MKSIDQPKIVTLRRQPKRSVETAEARLRRIKDIVDRKAKFHGLPEGKLILRATLQVLDPEAESPLGVVGSRYAGLKGMSFSVECLRPEAVGEMWERIRAAVEDQS